MTAVAGVSDHCGWAELVTLTIRDDVPVILERRRVELIDSGLASAPYHHEGLSLPLDKAEQVIRATRVSVTKHCRRVMHDLKASLGVEAIAIQESPYGELPDAVRRILASRAWTCAADGMMYREELVCQASGMGLAVHRFPRKSDPRAAASEALGCTPAKIATILSDFGKLVGPPWRMEHKRVAAAALCALAERSHARV